MTKACMQTMGQIVDMPAWWTRWSRPEPNSWRDQSRRGCLQPEITFCFQVFLIRLLFSNSANLTPAIDPEVNPLVHELFELWGVCLRHLGMLDKELWNRTHIIIGIDPSNSNRSIAKSGDGVPTNKIEVYLLYYLTSGYVKIVHQCKEKAQQCNGCWYTSSLDRERFLSTMESSPIAGICCAWWENQIAEDDWWKESKTFEKTCSQASGKLKSRDTRHLFSEIGRK